MLPPLGYLPPPVSLSSPAAGGLDLDVDFEMEVRPHLGICLVHNLHFLQERCLSMYLWPSIPWHLLVHLPQGTGGFGSVYQATWHGKKVAVKCLPNLDSNGATTAQYEALVREIELSSKFNSSRLVRVYGASLRNRATACLIMELAEGGNLHQRIYDPRRPRMSLVEALQVPTGGLLQPHREQ